MLYSDFDYYNYIYLLILFYYFLTGFTIFKSFVLRILNETDRKNGINLD